MRARAGEGAGQQPQRTEEPREDGEHEEASHQGACPSAASAPGRDRAHLSDEAFGFPATPGGAPGKAMGAACASSSVAAKRLKASKSPGSTRPRSRR
jgi:hypothetical protein